MHVFEPELMPMADRDDGSYASAAELAGRIRRRDVSPVEVMTATIGRIEKRNPSLNAFVFTDFEQAARQPPGAVICSTLQEDTPIRIQDDEPGAKHAN